MNKKPALGKGLASLLPPRVAPAPEAAESVRPPEGITELAIDAIKTNPNQPRKDFRGEQLLELALSISRDGVIQPLIVRKTADHYELVAGERRLRAAKIAGLTKVPVVVQSIGDERLLEIALVENIQREDLNPMELAIAFERMSSELNLNHEEIGARTGKDRATITNAIRLLQLPADLQDMVARRELTAGHARAILKLRSEPLQRELARRVIAEGLTVRQVERVTQDGDSAEKPPKEVPALPVDPNVRAAIEEMERTLGTRVKVVEKAGGKGKIEIEYYSAEDLDRIYSMITREA